MTGTLILSPLEVIKTRLQSSKSPKTYIHNAAGATTVHPSAQGLQIKFFAQSTTWITLRHLVRTEGVGALWRGIVPNLTGVVPARAVYFFTYNHLKTASTAYLGPAYRDSPIIHILSSCTAGFTCATLTNPIWLVKTRLQLNRQTVQFVPPSGRLADTPTLRCIRQVYEKEGIAGFYRGLTASYAGTHEL